MVAHREIFYAANLIVEIKGKNEISPEEIITVLNDTRTTHPETDIRTEMRRCCVDSPKHHYTKHNYFEEIDHGKYRLINR